mgnify:CR=1 FL=1
MLLRLGDGVLLCLGDGRSRLGDEVLLRLEAEVLLCLGWRIECY